jgi:hypothetical protein
MHCDFTLYSKSVSNFFELLNDAQLMRLLQTDINFFGYTNSGLRHNIDNTN